MNVSLIDRLSLQKGIRIIDKWLPYVSYSGYIYQYQEMHEEALKGDFWGTRPKKRKRGDDIGIVKVPVTSKVDVASDRNGAAVKLLICSVSKYPQACLFAQNEKNK